MIPLGVRERDCCLLIGSSYITAVRDFAVDSVSVVIYSPVVCLAQGTEGIWAGRRCES